MALAFLAAVAGAGPDGHPRRITVNSPLDLAAPPAGTETLRSAVARVKSGGHIDFDPALDGGTIVLTIVGEEHSILMGEVFPAGTFAGYEERDYGRSALYARKDLTIDASRLPNGITIAWGGGDGSRARVLAVLGDLTMRNVTVTGGYASAEPIDGGAQPYTLGRGGGLAVWGAARLSRCTLHGNRADGDENGSRDRGAFGGGIYGNCLTLTDCVIAGNAARGYGAAGGGVYSVGGVGDGPDESSLERCAVTGNRVTAEHAYGGGVYSDGGGPGNTKAVRLANCTLAGNLVEDHPVIGEPPGAQFYYRGGGFYMSNGTLLLRSCTVVGNAVTGHVATFKGKPNMGGGGLAATIGNAHVVERMEVLGSIVAGNTVNGAPGDVYTGSLMHFVSLGGNLVGALDMSQILVPVPPWWSLSRKHWPKRGDEDGVELAAVVSLPDAVRHGVARSVGVEEGAAAVLYYPPIGAARNRIPAHPYRVDHVYAQYEGSRLPGDDFPNHVLAELRTDYAERLGADFGAGFGDQSGLAFDPVANTWVTEAANQPWIAFWRALDVEIAGRLGPAGLNDDFWLGFTIADPAQDQALTVGVDRVRVHPERRDQLGHRRPAEDLGDCGAIEAGAAE